MEQELVFTCNLWVEQIKKQSGNTGDGMSNAFLAFAQSKFTPPTENQLKDFRNHLLMAMRNEAKPGRDVVLYTDYQPDELLAKCATLAGFDEIFIPVKSITRTNTGVVQYRFGYAEQWIIKEFDRK